MASTTTDRRFGLTGNNGIKTPVRAATTGNITLSGTQTVDGVALISGDRCLVMNQTDTTTNGIYDVSTAAWTRSLDFDGVYDVRQGTIVYAANGSARKGFWQLTAADPITIGTTSLTFAATDNTLGLDDSLVAVKRTATGAVATTLHSWIEEQAVNVFDFMTAAQIADVQARTALLDVTAAIVAADAALPVGTAPNYPGTGGIIFFPPGIYSISNYNPSKMQVNLVGSGMHATVLRANTAGATQGVNTGVITLSSDAAGASGCSRGSMTGLALDGNNLKAYCLGVCPPLAVGSASQRNCGNWTYNNILMHGATTDTLMLGNNNDTVLRPDVSSHTFIKCSIQGGSYGDVAAPSNSQVYLQGENTVPINFVGGVIGGGATAINIRTNNGGTVTFSDVQYINSTSYNFEYNGGSIRVRGGHSEGTGGFYHSLSADPGGAGIRHSPSIIDGCEMANTGATLTPHVSIRHEAPNQLSVINSFANEDFRINNTAGVLFVSGNRFGKHNADANYGVVIRDAGQVVGWDTNKGHLINATDSMYFGTTDNATYGSFMQWAWRTELVCLSASAVPGPQGTFIKFWVHEETNGNSAECFYYGGAVTVTITNLKGTIFVTGAPGAGQVQIAPNGTNNGVTFKAGDATYNNVKMQTLNLGLNTSS